MKARAKNPLGQYFTPRPVANLMVAISGADAKATVLEPSAGRGVFLDALKASGIERIRAIDIDPGLVAERPNEIELGDFLLDEIREKFDCVIGNPPYIRWRDLPERTRADLQNHSVWGSKFSYLADYLTMFIAQALDTLKEDGGALTFITPTFWLHTKAVAGLRDEMLDRGGFSHIITFGENEVFPGVSSAIMIFRYVQGRRPETIQHYQYVGPRQLSKVGDSLDLNDSSAFTLESVPQFQKELHWTLAPEHIVRELEAFEASCQRNREVDLFGTRHEAVLGSYVQIANGMVSGLDSAFHLLEAIDNLTDAERTSIVKVGKAKGLDRIRIRETYTYIRPPVDISEDEFREKYPNFAAQLAPYRDRLEKRYSYHDGLKYWEWAFPRSEKFFNNGREKIFVPCKERITARSWVRFALAPGDVVATQDVTALMPLPGIREDIRFLAAFLSSDVVFDWLRYRGLMKGGVLEFSEKPLSVIPFRGIDWDQEEECEIHDQVVRLVDNYSEGPHENVLKEINAAILGLVGATVVASPRD